LNATVATRDSHTGSMKKKSKAYFSIAIVLLVIMALSWSVDTSLVYIFLGAASFFLFLGFYNGPFDGVSGSFMRSNQYAKGDGEFNTSSKEFLKNILGLTFDSAQGRHLKTSDTLRKWIRLAGFSVFSILLITLIVNMLTSGDQSHDAVGYYQAAEQNYFAGEYDSAYANYRRAMKLAPEYQEAMVGYGKLLIANDELDSAVLVFTKVLEINPGYIEASYNKALAYYSQKKYLESIKTLSTIIDSNPEYYDAMLLLGDAYYVQRQYDDAIVWYENAYRNGGIRSRLLCHIMAYIYDTKGEYDKAIRLYQEALSYDSAVVEIYQRLGELIPDENGNFYREKAAQMSN